MRNGGVLAPLAGGSAGRVQPLEGHDDLAGPDQHFLDRVIRSRGWISPVFGVLLHSPDVAERIAHIGNYILYESKLAAPARALAWLITARDRDCAYAWRAGVEAANAAGVGGTLIADR
jgi:4-carboxymuconolactone decarboxylase